MHYKNFIEEIKRQNDIIDISQELIPGLKKIGNGIWRGSIRNEVTPALTIYAASQSWYHFAGDTTPRGKNGGDVISLVEYVHSCSPSEAIAFLAHKVGMELKPLTLEEKDELEKKKVRDDQDQLILEKLVSMFEKDNERAITYLSGRGIGGAIVHEYRIGWANYSQDQIRDLLKGYDKDAVDAVIAISSFFKDSLIIPIILHGHIVTLYSRSEGRILKHLFLKDHPKGIFNYDKALLEANDQIYVAEAVIDVLSCIQHGIKNVISIGGTQPGDEPKTILRRLSDVQIVSCFDNDSEESKKENPGYRATKAFMREFPNTLMKELPPGDLNDFFKEHSPEDFRSLPEVDWYSLLLNEIPVTTKAEGLLPKLTPLFEALTLGKDESDAILYIRHVIKDYFSLKEKDIDEVVKKYKKVQKDELAELLSGGNQDEKESQASLLLELIYGMGDDAFLFHTELKEPFIRIKIQDHHEIWSCKSISFKRWLSNLFWNKLQMAINPTALNAVITTLQGKAQFSGEEYPLYNRIALYEEVIWYDLADEKWRAVKISKDGWEIVSNPPILFRRYSHQRAQIEPISGGNSNHLLDFINVSDNDTKLLILVSLISSFIPNIPHIVFATSGNQGSAKTMFFRLLKSIIDPSNIETLSFPRKNRQELIQILSHHYAALFDNVSKLDEADSDDLCKAVTGSGFSKRELYSDDDDVIYNFKRVIGINGINSVIRKSDLLERSIVICLEKIPTDKRKQEKEILEQFIKELPGILGGIFDILTRALSLYPSIKLTDLPRMADYAVWSCAIAEAIGYDKKSFLSAYDKNNILQTENFLYDDIVASYLITFIERRGRWEGTTDTLLRELKSIGREQDVELERVPYWPKNASALSRWIGRIIISLSEIGIVAEKIDQRTWKITNERKTTADESDNDLGTQKTQRSFLLQSPINIMDMPY